MDRSTHYHRANICRQTQNHTQIQADQNIQLNKCACLGLFDFLWPIFYLILPSCLVGTQGHKIKEVCRHLYSTKNTHSIITYEHLALSKQTNDTETNVSTSLSQIFTIWNTKFFNCCELSAQIQTQCQNPSAPIPITPRLPERTSK